MLKPPKRRKERENRRMRNTRNKQKTNNKMVDLNPNISIITINVNGLNTPN